MASNVNRPKQVNCRTSRRLARVASVTAVGQEGGQVLRPLDNMHGMGNDSSSDGTTLRVSCDEC